MSMHTLFSKDTCWAFPEVKISMLKIGLILKSEGESMTYAFDPSFQATLEGPALCACSLVKIPRGNCSSPQQIITISPASNCPSLHLMFAEEKYDPVLREIHHLTSS